MICALTPLGSMDGLGCLMIWEKSAFVLSQGPGTVPEIPENGPTATGGALHTKPAVHYHAFVSPWSRPSSESS